MQQRRLSLLDKLLSEVDGVLKTVSGASSHADRPSPSTYHRDT